MKFKICREFHFDAAHHLMDYDGACERIHGHTYSLEVCVTGERDEDGMVMDFGDLKKIVQEKVISMLDHQDLNDVFDNPTCENIAQWIFDCTEKEVSDYNKSAAGEIKVCSVKLYEGKGKYVKIEG